MNKKTAIIIGVVVVLVLWTVGSYNGLVNRQVAVDQSWAQVENVLQRRSDLIPNLVATVKGYTKHERGVLDDLAQARTQYAGAKTVNEKMGAATQMGAALSRLLVIVENYPNLKANESFNRLMDELSGTENRIAVERKRYNEAVQVYDVSLRRFPQGLIASAFGFAPKPFFKAEPGAQAVPKVDFGQ